MRRYIYVVNMLLIVLVLGLSATIATCQEEEAPQAKSPDVATPAKEKAGQPEELSIYGEVQAVNPASNSVTVQYYDYDSDEEKTTEIVLDKATRIENAANLNEIKKGDWVDATYSIIDGKNVANSIIVEKEEEEEPIPLEPAAKDIPVATPQGR